MARTAYESAPPDVRSALAKERRPEGLPPNNKIRRVSMRGSGANRIGESSSSVKSGSSILTRY